MSSELKPTFNESDRLFWLHFMRIFVLVWACGAALISLIDAPGFIAARNYAGLGICAAAILGGGAIGFGVLRLTSFLIRKTREDIKAMS